MSNVSRETIEVLEQFQEMLLKWNAAINLISNDTAADTWRRHIADSIQVYNVVTQFEAEGHWVDIGSGGGLPGIVAAILDRNNSNFKFSLIESDKRKCAFLRQCGVEFGLNVAVYPQRIETVPIKNADVVSARALANLNRLISYAEDLSNGAGYYVFPKGKNWKSEIDDAKQNWCFDEKVIPSNTEENSAIVVIQGDNCERRKFT